MTLSAVFRAGIRMLVLLAVLIAVPCVARSDWSAPAQEEALTLNADLEIAARGHADYLSINNLSAHFQDALNYPTRFTGNTQWCERWESV